MHLRFPRALFHAVSASCALAWFAAAPAWAGDTGEGADAVIAIVDGELVYRSDLDLALGMLPPEYQKMPVELIYPALLDQVVDGKLIERAGRKKNLHNDPEVKARMKRVESRVLQQIYLSRYVESRLTEERLRAHYDVLVKRTLQSEEIHARHILRETRAQAEEIIRELEKGADFAELAKAKSIGPEAADGGDLDYFTRDEMVPEFSKAAFAIKPGDFSKEPVKTSHGWHVIKVEDRRRNEPPSYEDAKAELRTSLSQKILGALVADLRKKARIKLFNLDGSPMATPSYGFGKAP